MPRGVRRPPRARGGRTRARRGPRARRRDARRRRRARRGSRRRRARRARGARRSPRAGAQPRGEDPRAPRAAMTSRAGSESTGTAGRPRRRDAVVVVVGTVASRPSVAGSASTSASSTSRAIRPGDARGGVRDRDAGASPASFARRSHCAREGEVGVRRERRGRSSNHPRRSRRREDARGKREHSPVRPARASRRPNPASGSSRTRRVGCRARRVRPCVARACARPRAGSRRTDLI